MSKTISFSTSEVTFSVSSMMFMSAKGSLGKLKGEGIFKSDDLEASYFNVSIDAASIDTKNASRDEHLRKADFFDVEQFPTIEFKSTAITAASQGYKAVGELTLHGVTKEVQIPFTYANNQFKGSMVVNRTGHKIGPGNGLLIGKEVTVQIVCTVD